jgi:5-formyltetrahydrofolate cyclo-ligase
VARERALAARAGCCDTAQGGAAGAALAAHVLRECPPKPGAVVSGVWPLDGEIDLRPLMQAPLMQVLHARGHPIVLPVTPPRGQALTFLRWRPGDALVRERFGTLRPVGRPLGPADGSTDEHEAGQALVPDFLLVPLLAFDRRLHRLGYGGGYYDRTLAALPSGRFALGCGFAAQQMDVVPAGAYDVALDAVATERGVIRRTAI